MNFSYLTTCTSFALIYVVHDLGKKYIATLKPDRESPEIREEERNNIELNIISELPEFANHVIRMHVFSTDRNLDCNKPSCIDMPDEIEESDVPDEFKCPISKSIMKDPVLAADGFTYDRRYMEIHLRNSIRSPLNNENMLFPYLIPNWNIRKLIQAYVLRFRESMTQLGNNATIELPTETHDEQR